jgi:hypothetical protein
MVRRSWFPVALVLILVASATASWGFYSPYYPRPPQAPYHGVDHGESVDCWHCHWFDQENFANAKYVSPKIIGAGGATYTVSYPPPPAGPIFVNTERTGICQICHTQTHYWGATYDYQPGYEEHYREGYCLTCHSHWQPENLFRPGMKGLESHQMHLTDPRGPLLAECTDCHLSTDYSRFAADGLPLSGTTTCDPCHSKGGAFDGVDNVVIGAKPNWLHGVYEGTNYANLQEGKEQWCTGCHDAGTSLVKGVQAPDVAGDNSTWGYYVTGHKINCLGCHDATTTHCDSDARTYVSDFPSNYVAGYRLNDTINIPIWRSYPNMGSSTDYNLCLNCHDTTKLFDVGGVMKSNFRNDMSTNYPSKNLHYLHLIDSYFGQGPFWDSDWNSVVPDSSASCPACHNVHGSATPKMTRHGELVPIHPNLDFKWYMLDQLTTTTDMTASRYGSSQLNNNHICTGCHGLHSDFYYRVPYQVLLTSEAPDHSDKPLWCDKVWTTDLAGNPRDTFGPGKTFQVKAVYYVLPFSPAPPYVVTRQGNVTEKSSGLWTVALPAKTHSRSEGSYIQSWIVQVPSSAVVGQKAVVTVKVKTTLGSVVYKQTATCKITIGD